MDIGFNRKGSLATPMIQTLQLSHDSIMVLSIRGVATKKRFSYDGVFAWRVSSMALRQNLLGPSCA